MSDVKGSVVGLILSMEPSTPFVWYVALKEDAYLQLGDVVQVTTKVPGLYDVRISGIVCNVQAAHEGVTLGGDTFRTAQGSFPAELARRAEVRTTRVEPEVWVSPLPCDEVVRAFGGGRDEALYFDVMGPKLVAGQTRDGSSFFLDYDFVSGERGGHVNISGISGVATKTTYATFLLYSMFHGTALGAEKANTRAVIFNVKGEDLLFLDKPNCKLDEKNRAIYRAMGLPAEPFQSVGLWAPARKGAPDAGPVPETTSRRDGVSAYYWSVRDLVRKKLLRFMFAEANDAQSQVSDLAIRVELALDRECRDAQGSRGGLIATGPDGNVRIDTFDELVAYVNKRMESEDRAWTGGAASATVSAFLRRMESAKMHLGHLIRTPATDAEYQFSWNKQVTVIDVSKLHDRAKRFVVGVVLTRLFAEKEESGRSDPAFYVVLDELNKYAPRDGWSPIKEVLLDIAERGRSLKVLLMGAEQTASEVERRVVSNAAIRVVGRLDPSESQRGEYGFLDATSRQRAGLLKPGTMLVTQPHIPLPIEITFPFPAWATRSSEVAEEAETSLDRFARFQREEE